MPETKEVAQTSLTDEETKTATGITETGSKQAVNAVQRMQIDVGKFVAAMLNKDRAKEYQTRVALIARDNPKLAIAVAKNPESFLTAFMASATFDLMPNTSEGLAYLIPYGDKVQFQLGYKGLLTLARRSGEVKTINAELVFKGDAFEVDYGTERRIVHRPDFSIDRTDYKLVTHAYATARLTNGEDYFVVMTRAELDKVQKTAKASSTDSPWQTWPERQAIKTVLKRLTQLLPSGSAGEAAIKDSLAEAGKLKFDRTHGSFIEGEIAGELSAETTEAIAKATSHEELQEILDSLPVAERKKAASIVADRAAEL